MSTPPTPGPAPSLPWRGMAIGLAVMTLEGYDLVAFGSTTPMLLRYEPWNLSLSTLGLLGSLTPLGMLFGALLVGPATDRYGRRRTTLLSIVLVSLGMIVSATAAGPEMFGAGRLVVGLGVGAAYPAMAPLIFELAPVRRKNLVFAIVQCGVTVGGSLAAAIANAFLQGHDFRLEYMVGAAAGLVLLPMAYRWLPESPAYEAKPSRDAARDGGMRLVLRTPYLGTTVLFCAMVICSFLLIFGMNTWLPQLMQAADYPLGSSLTFLMLLNLGATIGGLAMAVLADRAGSRGTIIASFLVAAGAIAALSIKSTPAVLYLIVMIGGAGVLGVQGLINVYIARTYPVRARASAIGVVLGIGRIGAIAGPPLGGWILAADFAPRGNFALFALPALVGAILTVAVGGRKILAHQGETPFMRAEPSR